MTCTHDLAGQIEELKHIRRVNVINAISGLVMSCFSCWCAHVVANAKLADAVNYLVFRYALIVLFASIAIATAVIIVDSLRNVVDANAALKRLRGAGP